MLSRIGHTLPSADSAPLFALNKCRQTIGQRIHIISRYHIGWIGARLMVKPALEKLGIC